MIALQEVDSSIFYLNHISYNRNYNILVLAEQTYYMVLPCCYFILRLRYYIIVSVFYFSILLVGSKLYVEAVFAVQLSLMLQQFFAGKVGKAVKAGKAG